MLVNFGTTKSESNAFLSADYAQVMPQVRNGAVASPVGEAFISSVSAPTGLSLSWGLKDYVALLSCAAKEADARQVGRVGTRVGARPAAFDSATCPQCPRGVIVGNERPNPGPEI